MGHASPRARITPNGEKHRTEVTEDAEGEIGVGGQNARVETSVCGRESRQRGSALPAFGRIRFTIQFGTRIKGVID
jgi:hypothetical protein